MLNSVVCCRLPLACCLLEKIQHNWYIFCLLSFFLASNTTLTHTFQSRWIGDLFPHSLTYFFTRICKQRKWIKNFQVVGIHIIGCRRTICSSCENWGRILWFLFKCHHMPVTNALYVWMLYMLWFYELFVCFRQT